MNSLRETGYIICIILVITGIFMMLLPSGNTVKSVKFTIHLFLIISVIVPMFNIKADFSAYQYDYSLNENKTYNNLTELYNSELLESVEVNLTDKAYDIFKKYAITPEKIEILMNVSANQSIDITEINITLREADKSVSNKAISEINNSFGVTSKVIFVKGE